MHGCLPQILRLCCLSIVSLTLLAGCSDPQASRTTATVTGKVLVLGKPPKNGKITFDGRNPQRADIEPVTADIQADGSYSIEAPLGWNRVIVDSKEIREDSRLDQYRGGGELAFQVAEGENKQDFPIGRAP